MIMTKSGSFEKKIVVYAERISKIANDGIKQNLGEDIWARPNCAWNHHSVKRALTTTFDHSLLGTLQQSFSLIT